MNDFAVLPDERRRLFCEQAQAKLGLPPAAVEKDFWVCWILRELYKLPEWGDHLTFKGGTSLSKCWQLIDRFSEDIDIVVSRDFLGFGGSESPEEAPSKKQTRKRLDALKTRCQERIRDGLRPALESRLREELPDEVSWKLTVAPVEEDPDQQTLLFHYPETLVETSTYLRPVVKIEMGARSDTEPSEYPVVRPYLANAFPDVLGSSGFTVHALSPERTFWEKAMLLHEETYRPAEKTRKARLARHYYDLWSLIQQGVAGGAAKNMPLFERTARHREVYFNWSWMDYSTLGRGKLRLLPLDEQEPEWRQDYQSMAGEMFFGTPPSFDDIFQTVGDFERAFNHG